jgi:ATP-dependent helicase HrpB
LAWAYPDRIAFRAQTTGVSAQFQLPSGRMVRVRGALAAEETLVVAEADAGTAEVATVWLAAPLGRGAARAVLGSLIEEVLEVEWAGWRPRVFRVRRWGVLEFERTGLAVSDAKEAVLASLRHRLATDHRKLPWGQTSRQLLVRLSFVEAEGPVDWGWLAEFADWSGLDLRSGPELYSEASLTRALAGQLPFQVRQQLDSRAPESLVVPSGSRRKLEYREDGSEPGQFSVHMEVRIQEVFGLAASPRVAGVAVVLHLLSPGHKPLQITTDLASFWATTYQEVRKAMRGQYPRHYWPENPLEAEPTARPRPKTSPQ